MTEVERAGMTVKNRRRRGGPRAALSSLNPRDLRRWLRVHVNGLGGVHGERERRVWAVACSGQAVDNDSLDGVQYER